jgi:uncharacterized protein YggE
MRQREKARIWRRFMAGESVAEISYRMKQPRTWEEKHNLIESILREGLRGAFDPLPMNQARAYAKAAGVKVGRVVRV